jgi:arylsulfatase A-like enzyme
MYPPDKMTMPESIHDPMLNSPYGNRGDRRAHPEYADEQKIKYMIANYYALVTEVDDWVGKILNELDELGLTDNTMVIFTSDHGEMLGSHGMRGKFVFYEESVHVPLIVKYPEKIQGDTVVNEYVSIIDLFATILDYMEVAPSPSDGSSLRDLIEKKPSNHGDYVVSEWLRSDDRQSSYMVLSGGWKLICGYVDNATTSDALYDLNDDPYEIKNLLGTNPSKGRHKKTVERLKAQLMEWLGKTGSENLVKLKQRTTL